MNRRTFRNSYCLSVVLLLFIFGVRPAIANDVPISGSYEVVQKNNLGSQMKILVRFHLTNRGRSPLSVQGVLLADFAHPPSGGAFPSPVILPPGTPEVISREFVIPRLQFDQWHSGLRPRAVLQLQTGAGASFTQAIRMECVSTGKGE